MATPKSYTIGTWDLNPTTQDAAKAHLLRPPPPGGETSFEPDLRTLVPEPLYAPGGPYRSIVKLQIRYEKQDSTDSRWAQGTGWLIRDDLLVTAGHCVYDHSFEFGRAVEVKAYVGYNGKESVGNPNVQFRHGSRIATTQEWIRNDTYKANDVGFIQLESPFTGIIPFNYKATPNKGSETLEVVGYPADRNSNSGERGAQMYTMSQPVTFDLDVSGLNMLEYTISTYKGQSGSPVLIKGGQASIGAHVYGLGDRNAASVIRGKYGNSYKAHVKTFSPNSFSSTQVDKISYLEVPNDQTEDAWDPVTRTDVEGFWDTFKSVVGTTANVASNILQVGSPFLGPIGGPIAGLAGTVLGFAGKLAESSLGTESSLGLDYSYNGHCARAVLGEAALQTVANMDTDVARNYGIYAHMQKHFLKNQTHVKPLAKKFGRILVDPAMRIALANTNTKIQKTIESSLPELPEPKAINSGIDGKHLDFATGLRQAAKKQNSDADDQEQEGFLDSLISIGAKAGPPLIGMIGQLLKGGSESALDGPDDELQSHLETVCHRTLIGEAALQALMTIPPKQLEQEGFFGDMVTGIKKIGATVLKAAPGVIRTATPIIQAVLGIVNNNTAATAPAATAGLVPPAQSLRSKKSISQLFANGGSVRNLQEALVDTPTKGVPATNGPDANTRIPVKGAQAFVNGTVAAAA